MNSKRKKNVFIRIAVVLLCVVLFSSHLVSGMFAKYTAGADKIGDSAKAASVDLRVTLPQLDPQSGKFDFSVNNASAVSFSYDVIVAFSDPAEGIDVTKVFDPDSVKIGSTPYTSKSADGKVFTFTNFGKISPGTSTEYSLSFDIITPYANVDSTINKLSVYDGGFPFTVSVKATQVD